MFWLFIHYNIKHYTMITFRNLQTMFFSPLSGYHVGLFPCYIHQDPLHWSSESLELHRCQAWVLTTLLHNTFHIEGLRLGFCFFLAFQFRCQFRGFFQTTPCVVFFLYSTPKLLFLYHSSGFVVIDNLPKTSFYLEIHNMMPLLQNSRSAYQRCYSAVAICSI